ncbi:MAG: hypothetical protein AAFV71_18240 [Cyanobacteria bacterium J06633_8]
MKTMSLRFSSLQPKWLESSLSLMDYVVNVQLHMTAPPKQEFHYQSQARLEVLISRQAF